MTLAKRAKARDPASERVPWLMVHEIGIMEQPPLISGEIRGGDELFSDRLTL